MQHQSIFQRNEIKYLLTEDQAQHSQTALAPYMVPDRFAFATIRNHWQCPPAVQEKPGQLPLSRFFLFLCEDPLDLPKHPANQAL